MINKYSVPQCMDEIMHYMHNGYYYLLSDDSLLAEEFSKGTIESALSTLWLLGLTAKTHDPIMPYKLSYDGKQRCIGGYKFYKPGGNSYEEVLRCRLRHVQAMPNEVTIE